LDGRNKTNIPNRRRKSRRGSTTMEMKRGKKEHEMTRKFGECGVVVEEDDRPANGSRLRE
jgi:hypothetical protein